MGRTQAIKCSNLPASSRRRRAASPLAHDRTRSRAIAASPAYRERLRELVSAISANYVSSASSASCSAHFEIAELALDHAEVACLGSDHCGIANRPHQRQALRHPLTGLAQIARDLGTDAQDMKGVRPSVLVAGRLAHLESLLHVPCPDLSRTSVLK